MNHTKEVVILGAGLAGTTLAWQLYFRGIRPIIFDRPNPFVASRVAAGLITPITGLRMAISWNFDTVWPVARDFYRIVEAKLGLPIISIQPSVRLFQSTEERQAFHDRKTMLEPYLDAIDPEVPDSIRNPFGGFAMAPSAVLNVPTYLSASRRFLTVHENEFDSSKVDPETLVIRCCGYADRDNPEFPWVKFNPTKGDILTLDISDLSEIRTIHAAGWLARSADGLYRAGSTYEREDLTETPRSAGKDEVVRKIRTFLDRPFTILNHQSAIRPNIRESRPVIGFHPHNSRLAYFNGLGSKGSLMAPYYAGQLADAIVETGRIDAEVDVAQLPGAP